MRFLQPYEFEIRQVFDQSNRAKLELCNRIEGVYSLIMFTQKSCDYCKIIAPVFDKLAGLIPEIVFAKMDVDANNMQIVSMSKNTTTELRHVPFIVLYASGKPIATYDILETAGGIDQKMNEDRLVQFLYAYTQRSNAQSAQQQQQVMQQQQQQFRQQPQTLKTKSKRYACYLTFNDAYTTA